MIKFAQILGPVPVDWGRICHRYIVTPPGNDITLNRVHPPGHHFTPPLWTHGIAEPIHECSQGIRKLVNHFAPPETLITKPPHLLI